MTKKSGDEQDGDFERILVVWADEIPQAWLTEPSLPPREPDDPWSGPIEIIDSNISVVQEGSLDLDRTLVMSGGNQLPLREVLEQEARRAAGPLRAAEQKRRENQRKGGHARKYNRDLQDHVDRLVRKHPDATAPELWEMIPEADPGADDALIYRDGKKVVVVDDRTGRDTALAYDTFRTSYVPRAKKKR